MNEIQKLDEREELVRPILEAVPAGVVHVGSDGSIREANSEALRILGLRFDEITKRFISDFDPETIWEDGSACPVADYPVARVLATGKAQPPVTIGVRKPTGELSWAIFRAVPVLAASGELAGVIVTFLDITERKRAEEALRLSEEKWRGLAQNLPDFVVLTDREGRIQSINRVLPELEEARVLAGTVFDYLDETSRPAYLREWAHVLEKKEPARFETRGQGPAGKIVWYETQLVPLASPTGVVTRVLVVSCDITERRTMLASLAEKERLASVGMLAASVAHEIMNPLTYVLANLDFVVGERSTDPARRAKALLEAREGARRMQQIVWDLRALGRSGAEELFYVDARSILEIALRLSGPEVQTMASVVLDLHDVPCVLASESRLCQVFINLLVNAAQALAARPVDEREIRIGTRHDEQACLVGIAVADNGEGMTPERISRIFEPFFTTKPTGTGLGLSICRDIVERMGGRIDVESAPGAGTTFTVWLATDRLTQSTVASRCVEG